MARIHIVKNARKPQGKCMVCRQKEIKVGDPYKWAKPRYKGKIVACINCTIPISMLSSSKMVACWDAQQAITEATKQDFAFEDLASELDMAGQTAREVGEEYQESADNQREYFPDSETADENEERAQNLEEWADSLEQAAQEIRDRETKYEELYAEKEELEAEEQLSEEQQAKIEEISERLQDIWDEAVSEAEDASNECPD